MPEQSSSCLPLTAVLQMQVSHTKSLLLLGSLLIGSSGPYWLLVLALCLMSPL